MSALPAVTRSTRPARPARPGHAEEQAPTPRRHLEAVGPRVRRLTRPRPAHAIGVLVGVVAILLIQLGVSIAIADNTYSIAALKSSQRDLLREQGALTETLESLDSPQYLAQNAESLGMVASGSLPYLNLDTGKVSGGAGDDTGSLLGTGGISNTTLDGVGLVTPGQDDAGDALGQSLVGTGTSTSGSPSTGTTAGVSGSDPDGADVSSGDGGTLPSPRTH